VSASAHERLPAPRWLLAAALLVSSAFHLFLGWAVLVLFRPPSLDIEFEVPIDLELGVSEELAAFAPAEPVAPPAPPPSPAESAEAAKEKAKEAEKKAREDAGTDEPRDAGVADAPDAGQEPEPDAGPPLLADPKVPPGERLPPGSQIAVRVDMARIRKSPIAADVRALLAAVPDWDALLDGSGIEPVDQLDRLLIATPNLQREKVVVAGRFLGEPKLVDEAVQRLAKAQNVEAPWHTDANGIRIAPWANRDDTPRVIAIVGPSHFTIARSEDLPRVLAIAAARAEERPFGKKKNPRSEQGIKVHPADALLSMEAGEGLSLEVDGVANFVRKAKRGVPTKLRLSAVEVPGPRVELRGRMVFETPEKAADALRFWSAVRDSYARNALVMLLGLSGPLSEGVIELAESELSVKVVLSVEQTRLIVGYVRELITPPTPSPSAPAPVVPSPAGPSTSPTP
jgi:hypothetical protein